MWKVLIADDEPFMREGLTTLIEWEALGYRLEGAYSDGQELLDVIPHIRPDVVILDIQMPVLTGLEVAKILHQEWPEIHVILLTAYAKFQYAKEAIEYQVKQYIVKTNMLTDLPPILSSLHKELVEKRGEQNHKEDDIISKVEDYIEKNYHTKLALEEVAEAVHVNRCYLSRIFKERTGEKLFEYINKSRINKAKYYLEQTDKKVYEIAEIVGLGDTTYFSRVFKKYTGYSPSEYMKTLEQENNQ